MTKPSENAFATLFKPSINYRSMPTWFSCLSVCEIIPKFCEVSRTIFTKSQYFCDKLAGETINRPWFVTISSKKPQFLSSEHKCSPIEPQCSCSEWKCSPSEHEGRGFFAWTFTLFTRMIDKKSRTSEQKGSTFSLRAQMFSLKGWTFRLFARSFNLRRETFVLWAGVFKLKASTF